MKKILPWVATLVILVGAWLIAWATPEEDAGEQPFVTPISFGEYAEGRNLAVTVTSVHLAQSLMGSQGGSLSGNWVVFDLEASAVITAERATLRGVTLEVDGVTYRATERLPTLFQQFLVPGVPRVGTVAFEVAPFVFEAEEATLVLSLNDDPRADSQFTLTINPNELVIVERAEITPVDWARK